MITPVTALNVTHAGASMRVRVASPHLYDQVTLSASLLSSLVTVNVTGVAAVSMVKPAPVGMPTIVFQVLSSHFAETVIALTASYCQGL